MALLLSKTGKCKLFADITTEGIADLYRIFHLCFLYFIPVAIAFHDKMKNIILNFIFDKLLSSYFNLFSIVYYSDLIL